MADTGSDLVLGVIDIFSLLGLFVLTLVVRFYSARRDRNRVEQLMSETDS